MRHGDLFPPGIRVLSSGMGSRDALEVSRRVCPVRGNRHRHGHRGLSKSRGDGQTPSGLFCPDLRCFPVLRSQLPLSTHLRLVWGDCSGFWGTCHGRWTGGVRRSALHRAVIPSCQTQRGHGATFGLQTLVPLSFFLKKRPFFTKVFVNYFIPSILLLTGDKKRIKISPLVIYTGIPRKDFSHNLLGPKKKLLNMHVYKQK